MRMLAAELAPAERQAQLHPVPPRERRLEESFSAAHPVIPVAEVLAQPEDVHDLDGLRSVGKELARGVRLS